MKTKNKNLHMETTALYAFQSLSPNRPDTTHPTGDTTITTTNTTILTTSHLLQK